MSPDSTLVVTSSLAPLANWLLPVGVALALWLLLSFPAFLIERFFRETREKLNVFAGSAAASHARRAEASTTSPSVFNLFSRTHRLQRVAQVSPPISKSLIQRITDPIRRLNDTTRDAGQRMAEASEGLEAAARRLKGIRHERAPSLASIQLPPHGAPEEFKKLKRAQVRLLVSSVLIVGLVLVNTGMLSQVLKDVLEFGSRRIVAEIRLYHLIAFFATLVEAGLGFIMSASHSDDEPSTDRSYYKQVFLGVLVGGLAVVEGFFYSRIGAGSGGETSSIKLLGITLDMQHAFFVMGFILPLTLAGLGHMWGRALLQVKSGHVIDSLRRLLDHARSALDHLSADVTKVNESIEKLEVRARQVQTNVPQFTPQQQSALAQIVDDAKNELNNLVEKRKSHSTELVPASEQEVHREALRASVWLVLTVVASIVLVWVGSGLLGILYPSMTASVRLASSVLYCVVLLSCGLALRSDPLVLDEKEGLRPVGNYRSVLGRALAGLSIALVLVFSLLALSRPDQSATIRGMWTLVIGAGLSLVVLGRELPAILAVGTDISVAAWRGTMVALRLVVVLVMRLVVVLLVIVEFVARLIAAPVHWALGVRRPSKQVA